MNKLRNFLLKQVFKSLTKLICSKCSEMRSG